MLTTIKSPASKHKNARINQEKETVSRLGYSSRSLSIHKNARINREKETVPSRSSSMHKNAKSWDIGNRKMLNWRVKNRYYDRKSYWSNRRRKKSQRRKKKSQSRSKKSYWRRSEKFRYRILAVRKVTVLFIITCNITLYSRGPESQIQRGYMKWNRREKT
jgi:hypothetical protein